MVPYPSPRIRRASQGILGRGRVYRALHGGTWQYTIPQCHGSARSAPRWDPEELPAGLGLRNPAKTQGNKIREKAFFS